ncbi:peptidoglycan DD-metalloendopeptidase family protein [Accumulibacter sp.]|uniref:murein hydrolase activator EnvC family protein n=1 Tax=Accumulibacter sp. TaxID=2053492 RepID=UPI0025F7B40D|nr:peptidoglycan DD-metalloendopeptidase family protein [Accumulibacter sp.]MCM8611646.1 peptidoglycan DD-metalloendopeptidase family protein [Accumulibacter sp.]MCM8636003.1 peptidoglycan DD-metalloendopeptidase family protein [Accumulibacter sp.]MCM8640685.1 peptidoglycan DD-metalloendopeptidase family protein [Accumulibacter sp.]
MASIRQTHEHFSRTTDETFWREHGGAIVTLNGCRQAEAVRKSPAKTARSEAPAAFAASTGLCVGLLALLLGALAPAAMASNRQTTTSVDTASAGEVAEKQGNLKSLRSQIEALRRQMTAAEGSRRDAVDQLQEAERAISATQRQLHETGTETERLRTRLSELERHSGELGRVLNAQQEQLARLLHRQYLRGNPDPVRMFLNGDDPNQLARDLYYLEMIGRARREILRDIEATLQRQQALARDTRQQGELLAASEARQREEHARLMAQRQQRQLALSRVSEQIAEQRREIGTLQRDERRLAELVDRLARILAAQAGDARREAQRREPARPPGTREPASSAEAAAGDARAASPPAAGRTDEAASTTGAAGLARLKGQLRLPTRGSVSNRFGTTRQEGSNWKGLFILASNGSEVRSIAAGKVVFAEWMRGFGNLLIVDHGGGYLSIYANNESLLKNVGEEARLGEVIATVGNSGGNPESGLYFELRHQGRPLDPMAWVGARH